MKPYRYPRASRRLAPRSSRLSRPPTTKRTEVPPPNDDGPQMGGATIEFVTNLANESFKRQLELDESVWRSLPFFAATFAFVAAITGKAAFDAPIAAFTSFSIVANATFVLAILSLAWALRWFWPVLRPREYEIPADDARVRTFAEETTAYHRQLGLAGAELDGRVVDDLRLFMIGQYGAAARTNLGHNASRLKARSKVLLFMLAAFVLAFLCEATIFIHGELYGRSEVQRDAQFGIGEIQERAIGALPTCAKADAPTGAARH